jgi:hypothetical protein
LKSHDSYDDDEPFPPSKKQKSGCKSVITTSHEESTMTMRTMLIKIMMMTSMKIKNMMVMTLTRMMMIKYDKNENE